LETKGSKNFFEEETASQVFKIFLLQQGNANLVIIFKNCKLNFA